MKEEGKISLTMLDRSVKKNLTPRRNDLLLGAFAGRDFSAWQVQPEKENFGELRFATQSAVIYQGNPEISDSLIAALVRRVANDLYVGRGTMISACQAAVTLPAEGFEESELKRLMRVLNREVSVLGADLSGGHTMCSASVSCPVLSLTMIGAGEVPSKTTKNKESESQKKVSEENSRKDRTPLDLVLAGRIGSAGTGILSLLCENREGRRLSDRYSADYLAGAKELGSLWSVQKTADSAWEHADSLGSSLKIHNLSEGGVFDGLWEFGEILGCGMTVDLRKIPVAQETVELSEFFGVNPYRLLSTGAILIACREGEALVRKLWDAGIVSEVVGQTEPESPACIFRNEEEIRYMEKPQGEELWRILCPCGKTLA